ncbi:hypothetical protein ZEAMMB73_Zm00001d004325 [Zea mays]|uniref:Replication factor A C-terminal domain-containing protein n=1 Tax=Zea mays TaxID=4577 RepID=A0A1D6EET7_MAIZE|nr:hypothetical protein ZEAMMB73_Zm00001d004325 [Zea mays]
MTTSNFSISDVYNQSSNQPIVILLVGFLAKRFKGQPYLSGTTASSWYFNPGIPEAQTYYSRCHKSSSQTSTGYHCTSCGCTDINFRYKLSFIATDGTCEAEFFCFDSIARKIVGKPCDNLVTAVTTSQGPPAALAAIVCLKFTLAVAINMSAYSVTNRVFSILSILTNHGRQSFIPSNMPSHPQQELHTQDEIPSLPTTQDSPATSMAKLSTCSNKKNEARRILIYSDMPHDTEGDDQHISEVNNQELSSPPKRIKHSHTNKGAPDLTDPKKKSS